MQLTATANFLNTFFSGYDRLILSALHAVSNGFFTFLFKLITLIGEKGLVFFLFRFFTDQYIVEDQELK